MSSQFDLVVASHLRWNFVWQRPQQILSRISKKRRVLFIEEPVFTDSPSLFPSLKLVAPNIITLAPELPPQEPGMPIWHNRAAINEQVKLSLRILSFKDRALWFYTPLPDYLVESVEPNVIVYDVMDELANFKFAPENIKEQERRLLKRADVVFTGGASMYEAKKEMSDNIHLYASGVDSEHYSKACLGQTEIPEWMNSIPSPRVTYIGVIDERIDYDLIARSAKEKPDVQFLMVGPVVKVDPNDLPKAENIHYLGQKTYNELPSILKGTDVCMMPFALNDSTKFISPTKTLEYMAAHKPIISTPIRDVERFYSEIVYLGQDHDDYINQIELALEETAAARSRRRILESAILASNSWDRIAAGMENYMTQAYLKNTHRSSLRDPLLAMNASHSLHESNPVINGTAAGGGQ